MSSKNIFKVFDKKMEISIETIVDVLDFYNDVLWIILHDLLYNEFKDEIDMDTIKIIEENSIKINDFFRHIMEKIDVEPLDVVEADKDTVAVISEQEESNEEAET